MNKCEDNLESVGPHSLTSRRKNNGKKYISLSSREAWQISFIINEF